MIQTVQIGWFHRSLAELVDQVSLAGLFQAVLVCSELSYWFRGTLTKRLGRSPVRGTQPMLVGDSSPVLCARDPSLPFFLQPCDSAQFYPSGWGQAWSAGRTSRERWWVCIILTNPRSSGNYIGLFAHNRKDPRRFRVKWFFTFELMQSWASTPPVFFSRSKVWGSLQWQVHLVLEGSWTFGPQHISQLFITAANSCSFALDVYLECVLQPPE